MDKCIPFLAAVFILWTIHFVLKLPAILRGMKRCIKCNCKKGCHGCMNPFSSYCKRQKDFIQEEARQLKAKINELK